EGGAGLRAVRVRDVALREEPLAAGVAAPARDRGRDDDPVALLHVADVLPDLLDDAHALVAEDRPRLHAGEGAADEVEVGPADGAPGEAHDGVGRLLDLRLGHVLDADVPD